MIAVSVPNEATHSLILRWGEPFDPLPLTVIRGTPQPAGLHTQSPPWLATGPEERPFDFCAHVRRLCDDPRAYQAMGYLNTKPAVIYLKKVLHEI